MASAFDPGKTRTVVTNPMGPMVEQELLMHFKRLDAEEQRRVLDLTRKVASCGRCGASGKWILCFEGAIGAADSEIIAGAI